MQYNAGGGDSNPEIACNQADLRTVLTLPPLADVVPDGPYGRLGLRTNDLPWAVPPRCWLVPAHGSMANWESPRSLAVIR